MKKQVYFWNFILLALLGGGIGLQEFYVKRYVAGIFDVLFCWTGVPAVVAFIEAFVHLFKGEVWFNNKFNTDDRVLLND